MSPPKFMLTYIHNKSALSDQMSSRTMDIVTCQSDWLHNTCRVIAVGRSTQDYFSAFITEISFYIALAFLKPAAANPITIVNITPKETDAIP